MEEKPVKPVLEFKGAIWEGEDDTKKVSMSNETFFVYVHAYLEAQGLQRPTSKQTEHAITRCRALSYWNHCKDRRVQVRRKVTHANVPERDNTSSSKN